jgi:hypothetical protein
MAYLVQWFTVLKNGGTFHGELLNNQLVTLHCCWFHILTQTQFEGLCENGVHSKIPFIIIFAITLW